jgi:hypothetical protein
MLTKSVDGSLDRAEIKRLEKHVERLEKQIIDMRVDMFSRFSEDMAFQTKVNLSLVIAVGLIFNVLIAKFAH